MTGLHAQIKRSILPQGLQVGARLVAGILLARALGPEARGELALALWVPMLFNSFCYLGFGEGSVALMSNPAYRRERVLASLTALSLASIALGSLVYMTGAPWFLGLLHGHLAKPLYFLAFPLFPMTLLWAGWGYAQLGLGRVMVVNWGRVLNQAVLLLVLVVGAAAFDIGAQWAVAAYLAGSACELMLVGWSLHRQVPLGIAWAPEIQRLQVRRGFQSTLALWVTTLVQRLDPVLVTWAGGVAGVGFYAVAAGMRDFLLAIPEIATRPVIAEAAQARPVSVWLRLGPTFRRTCWLLVAVALIVGLMMPYLIALLYSGAFMPSVAIGRWLLVGFVALGMVNVLSAALTGMGKMSLVSRAQLGGLACLLIAASWLGPRWGVSGIAAAVSCSQWVVLLGLLSGVECLEAGAVGALLGMRPRG